MREFKTMHQGEYSDETPINSKRMERITYQGAYNLYTLNVLENVT
jgi:hypothetical protein